MTTFRFQDLWIAQVIRQKEAHGGPFDDHAIITNIKSDPHLPSLEQKIMARAQSLAKREGLTDVIQQWRHAMRIALWVLAFLAVFSGATLAFNALDTQHRHINILMALIALLGLHGITFLLWVLSLCTTWQQQSALGRLWLWLSKKLARSPDAALVIQAFIHTAHQAMRWIVGSISHGFWLIALTVALCVFLTLLAAQHYQFSWETTILPDDAFVRLTHLLGSIPAIFGFPIPDTALIAQSNKQAATLADAQKIWSMWLTGQLLIWGIALRFIGLIGCLFKTHLILGQLHLEIEHSTYASLISRLSPQHTNIAPDTVAPRYKLPTLDTLPHTGTTPRLIVGLELPPQQDWPIITLHRSVTDGGKIETREERHQLLARLSRHPVKELLIVCNGQQTPDRGIAYFIRDISQFAQQTTLYLHVAQADQSRQALWEKSLREMGIAQEAIWHRPQQLSPWSA